MPQRIYGRKSQYLLVGGSAVAIILAASALPSLAAGGDHGGGGGGAGGVSGAHSSEQGITNSNGPNSTDRDKGLSRAEDRRSSEGTENSKASGKHKVVDKDKKAKDKDVVSVKKKVKDTD
jgi:hypothetical protein